MDSFNNNDPFKQFVKGKLADYKQEVPPASWDDLEQSILAVQKTKVVHTRRLASSVTAIAAALIGVFFLFQNTNNELPTYTADTETKQQIESTSSKEKSLIKKESSKNSHKSTSSLIADNASTLKQAISTKATTTEKKESTPSNISDKTTFGTKKSSAAEKREPIKEKAKSSNDIDEAKKQQMIQDFINEGKKSTSILTDNVEITKKKSRYAVSLTGQSAFGASQETNTLPTTLRASVNDTYSSYTMAKMQAYNEEEEVNPESKTNHNQPISFGILTSFDITPKLQIETGLIYTYLSSETTNKAEGFINREKVQFHYLGIPVNVNYSLLSIDKLNLFATAGAMIEKDIDGKIKYNDEKVITSSINSGYANQTSSKINQKNPQLSFTAGVGATYPLYKNTKLFGKIGGRYYINANNEYRTYYSDDKFGLDIQLGIKFNF